MIDVEVIGAAALGAGDPPLEAIVRLCRAAAAAAGVEDGHVAVHFVDEAAIAELNARHRDKPVPTDVLAFPIDGAEPLPPPPPGADAPPRELGDVVICPPRAEDIAEVAVHGVLHLVGMDHEHDDGEMLALQAQLLAAERSRAPGAGGARA